VSLHSLFVAFLHSLSGNGASHSLGDEAPCQTFSIASLLSGQLLNNALNVPWIKSESGRGMNAQVNVHPTSAILEAFVQTCIIGMNATKEP
jgi:hypothetical protein